MERMVEQTDGMDDLWVSYGFLYDLKGGIRL